MATVGLVYLGLVIARLAWRAGNRPPDLPPDVGEFSRRASHAAHLLLYALMVERPRARVRRLRVARAGVRLWPVSIDFAVPSDRAVFHPAEEIHSFLAYALFGLAGLHAAGALWHHFVRRDRVLMRMLPGGPG